MASACAAAPARAALPSTWNPGAIAPDPATAGAHFGESIVNAGDLDGDGLDDVVVGAPDFTDSTLGSAITGRVYAFGTNGAAIWPAPASPPSPQAANVPGSNPTRFGAKVARLGDIGQCLSTGDNCTVGAPDGFPDLLVSAPGTDTGGGAAGADQGAVYVVDGATGRILKQVQLSPTERPSSGSGGFGKSIAGLVGQPPCFGVDGVGACMYDPELDVALGDAVGDNEPDFLVGAPNYAETDFSREDICLQPICPDVGRVYVFSGGDISGSSATPMTEDGTTTTAIGYPGALGDGKGPQFGATVAPAGDLGRCFEGTPDPGHPDAVCVKPAVPLTPEPDGKPDFVAGAPGLDLPGAVDAGAVFLMDPGANAAMARVDDSQPGADGAFGSVLHGPSAVGDLGKGRGPDVVVGSPASGRAVAFDGDPTGPALIANLTGPGSGFGEVVAGLGDNAGDAPGEIAIGAPGGGGAAGQVHIASACAGRLLKTLTDPDTDPVARFGSAIAPVGDRNFDGFIDLAVGAPGAAGGAGRVQVFTSTGPASSFTGCGGPVDPDDPGTPGGPGGQPTTPKTTPTKVRARVLRRLALVPSRHRLYRGSALKLKGSLKASAGQASCQRRQKIALQRRQLKGGRYQTFDVAITAKNGRFTMGTRPLRSYLYRARVSQTPGCMGATSKAAKVVVRGR